MAVKNIHLPISPSKTLLKFANRIAILGTGPVLDAPCGYGRNAVALASLGCSVIAIDNNPKRLRALEQSKASYIARESRRSGQIATICADLRSDRWIFAPSSFSAIICVHFEMIDIHALFYRCKREGTFT
jgi:predicted RNA methylase